MCCPVPNMFSQYMSSYPFGYMSTFAGRTYFNMMPVGTTYQQAMDIQNLFNPFYQFNRMMNMFTSSFNPYQNMQQMMLNQSAYNQGWQIGESIGLNSFARSIASNIASLKSQLETALTSDKLTSEHKKELKELKRQVEALEDKLADVEHLRQSGATNEQVRTALNEINSDYRELRDKIQEIAERIQSEISEVEEADDADEIEDDKGGDEVTTPVTTLSGKIGTLDTVSFNEDMVSADVDDDNVREIANTIYKKVDGIGSDNIKKYIDENINKDNVVEVMLYWNKQYAEGYAKADHLGLTETLMDERLFKGCNICTKILESLEERFKDYQDVNSELYCTASTQLNIARQQHDAWWTNEDKMSEALNKAHKCIVILMAEKAEQDKKA